MPVFLLKTGIKHILTIFKKFQEDEIYFHRTFNKKRTKRENTTKSNYKIIQIR